MTVPSALNRVTFAGDGSTTVFSTSPVRFFDDTDLTVYLVATADGTTTLQTITTHYAVTGGDGAIGTVTMTSAPSSAYDLLILRVLPVTQETDFVNNDPSDAEVAEDALDKLTMIAQQQDEAIGRALLLNVGSDLTDVEIPDFTGKAGYIMSINDDEDGFELVTAADIDLQDVSAFAATLLDDTTAASFLTTLGVSAFVQTVLDDANAAAVNATIGSIPAATVDAKGDLIVGTAADTVARMAVGSTQGHVPVVRTIATTGLAYGHAPVPGLIWGLTLSNDAGDTANDVNVTAGYATDSSHQWTMQLAAEITKKIDAAWAVGDDQGGLDGTESVAGTPDVSTWYYVYLIMRQDTGVVDVIFSENATTPTLPTNYTHYRRIGAVFNDASGNVLGFTQTGDWFTLKVRVSNYATTPTTTASSLTLTVPANTLAHFGANWRGNSANGLLTFYETTVTALTPGVTNASLSMHADQITNAGDSTAGHFIMRVDSSRNIMHDSSAATGTLNVHTIGWIDTRGKDA